MSDRILWFLTLSWLGYALFVGWHFFHPSYNWTPQEVARDRVITR